MAALASERVSRVIEYVAGLPCENPPDDDGELESCPRSGRSDDEWCISCDARAILKEAPSD